MNRILTLAGGAVGSYLGWMVGRLGGLGLAFFLSLVGLGLGHYFAHRYIRENLL